MRVLLMAMTMEWAKVEIIGSEEDFLENQTQGPPDIGLDSDAAKMHEIFLRDFSHLSDVQGEHVEFIEEEIENFSSIGDVVSMDDFLASSDGSLTKSGMKVRIPISDRRMVSLETLDGKGGQLVRLSKGGTFSDSLRGFYLPIGKRIGEVRWEGEFLTMGIASNSDL